MPARRQWSSPPGDGTTTASTSGQAHAAWMSTRSVITVMTGIRRGRLRTARTLMWLSERVERHHAVGMRADRSPSVDRASVTERSTVRSSNATAGRLLVA